MAAGTRVYHFGAFTVDARTGELSHAGRRAPLRDQSVQLLLALLEQPGELVTRDQLRRRLWAADTFVDFDRSCLLYTSPSPRDRQKSRMPSSA